MKKTKLFISTLLFVSLFSACSDDNSAGTIGDINGGINEIIPERNLSLLESEQFDTSSGNLIASSTSFFENGKLKEILNYQDGSLWLKVIYEYNSQGLVNRVLHFDGSNTSLSNRDFSVLYDVQGRVRTIDYANYISEFTYNSTDNTISRRTFDSSNPNLSLATYYLNDNNQITRFENSLQSSTVEFEYVNNKLSSGTLNLSSSPIEVDYGYDDFQDARGFSYHKLYKSMYGTPNNSVFTSERSIENMISLFYGEENPSLVAYYASNPTQEVVTHFVYTRDAENYVTEFDMVTNGSLYSRVNITYED